MHKATNRILVVSLLSGVSLSAGELNALSIGVDAVHQFGSLDNLANGDTFDTFRATITAAGHTVVPLTSFSAAELATVDAAILKIAYTQNAAPYSASQAAAVHAFASNTVFISDASLWVDPGGGSDRSIAFGDNQQLLRNIINFVGGGHGVLFVGENGTGFDVANMNAMTSLLGVTYANNPTDDSGRTVSGFVPHPITSGITSIGVDFQLPLTIAAPALDLTTGGGLDNILAVSVPEPGTIAVGIAMFAALAMRRTRSRR